MDHTGHSDTSAHLDRPIPGQLRQRRPWAVVAAIILAVSIGWAVRAAVDPWLPAGFPYVTFFPGIILIAYGFGWRAGAITAFISGLVAWYGFIDPRYSFATSLPALVALGFYVMVVSVNILMIHWLQQVARRLNRERRRSAMLAEQRELLFAELQHRVSNNLQLVGSLLSVQKRGVQDPAARLALEQASLRLSAIGRISRELYHIDGAGEDIGAFLQRLTQAILEASGRTGDISISWRLERAITLDSKAVLPLALVFTEALSNVLEHAYPDGAGPLDITLRRLGDDRCELMLDDEGRGVAVELGSGPATLAAPGLSGPTSLGLSIAAQLAQQLDGSFTLTRRPDKPGSRARLDIGL